jgi:hypothetical protein
VYNEIKFYKYPDRKVETTGNDFSSSISHGRLLRTVSIAIPTTFFVGNMLTLRNEHGTSMVNEVSRFLSWIAYDKPTSSKHKQWLHPIVVCLIHYTIVGTISFGAHDFFLYGRDNTECSFEVSTFRQNVTIGCGWYTVAMQACRLYTLANKQAVVYETTWLCNVTLVMGPLGLYWNRPVIASAYCISIGIDQLLWYIDLFWYTMR